MNPRNVRGIEDADGVGEAGNPHEGSNEDFPESQG